MEFIEFLSADALAELKLANAELVTMVANVDKVGQKMKNIVTPSGSDGAIKQLNSEYAKQQKLIASMQIQLERYAQAQNRTKISTNQLEQSEIRLTKAKEQQVKALEREQAKLNASTNIYNKVQAKINSLTNDYKELATRKELGISLTAKEEATYTRLQNSIQRYDKVLKGVDASMGKYQRNVGNYASAFNPVSNSINQLTREMPAFANSVQTGFMAISNNLPIFFDAMQQAIAQQKELQAQGQPSKSALSILASGFFTLGTALSLGVTALTIFGPLLIDSIFNTKEKAKADEEAKKAIEEKDKAEQDYIDTMRKTGSEEISRSQILFENAKNINMSMKDRLKAIEELRNRYPDYLGNLSNEAFLSGKTADAENRLNDALLKRGIAIALQGKLQKVYDKLSGTLLTLSELEESRIKIDEKSLQIATKLSGSRKQATKDLLLVNTLQRNSALQQKKAIEEQLASILKLYNEYAPFISIVNEDTKATDKNTEAKKKNNKEIEKKGEFLSKERLQYQINTLKEELELTSKLNPAYSVLSNTLKGVDALYEALYGEKKIVKAQEEIIDAIELTDEAVYSDYYAWLKLKEATDSYLKTLTSDAFNKAFDNIGLSSAKMFLDFDVNGQSTFDKLMTGADTLKEKFAITFQAVGDIAQDVFNKISELSNQRFQEQYANLQQEKEIALAFAGDSVSAREEIERQYKQRQREIKRREFQAKKQQALFNIAVDTAQGIMSALATGNVPLSIAIGVAGLVQAGLVASQQVPQFWKGTDNAPEGWALTQERGREIITDSKGNIKSLGNDKGATPTYLNKGDKVFTNSESMAMFNDGLNNILTSNGIDMPKVNIVNPKVDLTPVVNAINNKESVSLNIDKGGLDMYVKNGHSVKQIMNNKVRYIGKSV